MAVRPPHSAEEWSIWQDACIQTNRRHFLPQDFHIRRWPDGFPSGPGWLPLAEDHPFKGSEFCWRCVAEASGLAGCEVVPHRRAEHVICWGPAEGNPDPEDTEPDPGPAVEVTTSGQRVIEAASVRVQKLDASGRPVGEPEDLGSASVAFGIAEEPEAADTGNLFWPPPGWSVSVPLPPEAFRRLHGYPPEPVRHPVHEPPWYIGEDGRHRYAEDFRDSWPPSWADDAPALEPVPPYVPEREAQHGAEPVEADPAEDEDRQPGTDAEA